MDIVLGFSLLLFCGFIVGSLLKKLGIPSITGYIITGVIFGESVLGIQTYEQVETLVPITNLGLGIIALTIGEELVLGELKELGASIFNITLLQFLASFMFVVGGMLLFDVALPLALILGVMAATTGPAAITAVIEEYKTEGPFTNTLLATVALNDVLCIMAFGLTMTAAELLVNGSGGSILTMLSMPVIEIVGSIIVGYLIAWLFSFLAHKIDHQKEYLLIVLTVVLMTMQLAGRYHLSPLLINLMAGFALTNFFNAQHEIREVIEAVEVPIYVAFFTLAGAKLHLGALFNTGIIGIAFIFFRVLGKILGARAGAVISNSIPSIKNYLGVSLIAQAGVAVGLIFIASSNFPQFSDIITSVVLASVAISELLGPLAAKLGLTKADEVNKAVEADGCSIKKEIKISSTT
ncbi:cation:proton antiporter [Acetohalobium arabaticum]|uniref:Transporter, CPA2 family (2.A.37) n=1 Tax=Acetohalobium arabaticum (strain ATCC 49924 / DSM 5501 / Z-7288) TaxID=574087 RepID=D9QQ34_ACEAZ|nr:cation:proton antiporter [Acetohalobium arabaticum]ADL12625.1 transporter, CPA2 family (2.A.37) [Acetohalobium arabaticum DSM 5501]